MNQQSLKNTLLSVSAGLILGVERSLTGCRQIRRRHE